MAKDSVVMERKPEIKESAKETPKARLGDTVYYWRDDLTVPLVAILIAPQLRDGMWVATYFSPVSGMTVRTVIPQTAEPTLRAFTLRD